MGGNGEKSNDFYKVLGLKKECSESELKIAYKKLALKWHPDRCSASGNSKYVEEAKNKFQTIQEAYSVLSNENKRFLYDMGVYDSDDDENGMADFMSEMAVLMTQNKPHEKGESCDELKDLFEEMFHSDTESSGWTSTSYNSSSTSNKRGSSAMSQSQDPISCLDGGVEDTKRKRRRRKRGARWEGMPNANFAITYIALLVKTISESS